MDQKALHIPARKNYRHQGVTIKLMSGESLNGHMLGFSPIMHTLHFFETNESGDTASRKLTIEDIVFVGLHHVEGSSTEPPSALQLQHMDELKVITVNRDSFDVFASPTLSNTPGFFAVGKDDSLPYERIFFYHHGVRYQEKPERLGDLLIDQESIDSADLQHALDAQAQSMPSLGEVLKNQGKVKDADIDHALLMQGRQRMKMGDLLVDQNLVTAGDVQDALEVQGESNDKPLGHILIEKGKVEDKHIDSVLKIQSRGKMRLG
ncbi:hypothetical protein JYT48_02730, partial [Mariprofundus ferrooxydans]|nr:hypothetical protein [Mariprofundus ferrooxydans]